MALSFYSQGVAATAAAIRIVREECISNDVFSAIMPALSRTMRIAAPVAPTAFGQNQKRTCV
ncbi:hypothetical protein KPSA1_06629 [Pseudomonas syringae pv. actinidiae]|uniref:Uncharacterized protein n=1 Tax=Pseudomonas syringae pv. actinidiae TaxID=103796 RepID=A0A2G9KV39_PSESF|nr:hypothetical protein CT122_04750 [Pseudomonas syringae pv. actinidiae]PIN58131.1 hypothetical protein CUB86_29420 [Pseudomonas syringae pv. actinidiae]GBH13147.1 hypothetical protein KPSA1_06629 [Pseudomonas syringae pv. actinidiae]GBH15310.1 hypothetical protein KPSA3_01233 [Pseudomonas syringae pv. actinidiae]